jgi:ribosome biogenesis protein Nip4
MFSDPQGFADAVGVSLPSLHRHHGTWYVVPEQLSSYKEVLSSRMRMIGLSASHGDSFTPSPALVSRVASEDNAVFLTREGAVRFCYGDSVDDGMVRRSDTRETMFFVFDHHRRCVGFGRDVDGRVEPVLDRGVYVRERR